MDRLTPNNTGRGIVSPFLLEQKETLTKERETSEIFWTITMPILPCVLSESFPFLRCDALQSPLKEVLVPTTEATSPSQSLTNSGSHCSEEQLNACTSYFVYLNQNQIRGRTPGRRVKTLTTSDSTAEVHAVEPRQTKGFITLFTQVTTPNSSETQVPCFRNKQKKYSNKRGIGKKNSLT